MSDAARLLLDGTRVCQNCLWVMEPKVCQGAFLLMQLCALMWSFSELRKCLSIKTGKKDDLNFFSLLIISLLFLIIWIFHNYITVLL